MYCKECGFQLSDDAKFCPNCGTKVELNGIGNIEKGAVWGTIESYHEHHDIDLKSITDNAQWENTTNLINKYVKDNEGKKLIIRTKATTNPNVFINYYCYNDSRDELSPKWYVNSTGQRLSDDFDEVESLIEDNLTFICKNGKWACAKLDKTYFKVLTPFVFEIVHNNGYAFFEKAKGEWGKYLIGKIAKVKYCEQSCVLTKNMELYKIHNIESSTICGIISITVLIFLCGMFISLLWDYITVGKGYIMFNNIATGIVCALFSLYTVIIYNPDKLKTYLQKIKYTT